METGDESKLPDSSDSSKDRLDSWKEIAVYLGKDLRTARRWEKKEGLPVHRQIHDKSSTVYSFKSEVEVWRMRREPKSQGKGSEADSSVAASATAQSQISDRGIPIDSARSMKRSLLPGAIAIIVAILGVSLLAFSYLIWKRHSIRPSRLSYDGSRLIARGDDDRILWSVPLTDLFISNIHGSNVPAYLSDLDGDGSPEVLACTAGTPSSLDPPRNSEVFCFSSEGKPLWTYTLDDTFLFGRSEFGPPWSVRTWFVNGTPVRSRIGIVVKHFVWWPSVLILLDGRGTVIGKYVNSGWIDAAQWLDLPTGPVILAGGVSNSHDMGMMAVLDPDQISGSSPEESGSEYQCKNCPPGRPSKYFVFPRSELNHVLASQYHSVLSLSLVGKTFMAHTLEADARIAGTTEYVDAIYEFSLDMELKRAAFSDRYWEVHRRLEAEGKIGHTREACPDRDGPRLVRLWDAKGGWRNIYP